MSACLVAESGHSAALDQRVVSVGSDARADIPISGGLGLAPLHYEIMPNEHGYWIRRLHQDYPLLINGRQVDVALLQDGDVICAGELKLKFWCESETPALISPAAILSDHTVVPESVQPADSFVDSVSNHRSSVCSSVKEDSELRTVRLMEDAQARMLRQVELLKKEQNFGGAMVAALVVLVVSVFAYSVVCNFRWELFIVGILALGYGIGWVVKVVGKGQDPCFGQLAGGTALASILLVNFLAANGLFEMYEEVSEPVATTQVTESKYSSEIDSREKEANGYDGSGWAEAKNADDYVEQGRLAALQATKAASEGARIAMHEPAPGYESAENLEDKPTPNSTVTVVQTVGFLWIMFGPKSLVAYFLMTAAAYLAAFRSLSNQEASALRGLQV